MWLNQSEGWSWFWSIVAALGFVVCFRGVIDNRENPYEIEARRAVADTRPR